MAKKLTKAHLAITLAQIVAATREAGFMYVPAKVYEPMVADGLVEINEADVDEYGCVATRATDDGLQVIDDAAAEAAAQAEQQVSIEIEDDIAIPARATRRAKAESYPFSQLKEGQSFMIANGEYKEVLKHVARANKRYIEEIAGQTRTNRKGRVVPATKATRQFIAREVNGGVRVWRQK